VFINEKHEDNLRPIKKNVYLVSLVSA